MEEDEIFVESQDDVETGPVQVQVQGSRASGIRGRNPENARSMRRVLEM